MDYIQEPKLTTYHNFNLTDIEGFALFVAENTNRKVNLIYNDTTKNKTIGYNNNTTLEIDLIEQNPALNSAIKWVLEKGEEAFVLYQDTIDINIPFEMDYFEMYKSFQENNLKEDAYFNQLFNVLNKLGLTELYVANFEEVKSSNQEWLEMKKNILQTKNHFIINL